MRIKTVMEQMNAEKPDDVLADLEAKHGPQPLPCPFCGVEARFVNAPYAPRIYCRHDSTCLLRAQIVYDFQLREWNRRANPQ